MLGGAIRLVAGIFVGFLTVVSLSGLGPFAIVPGLGAILMIVTGIQDLLNGGPPPGAM